MFFFFTDVGEGRRRMALLLICLQSLLRSLGNSCWCLLRWALTFVLLFPACEKESSALTYICNVYIRVHLIGIVMCQFVVPSSFPVDGVKDQQRRWGGIGRAASRGVTAWWAAAPCPGRTGAPAGSCVFGEQLRREPEVSRGEAKKSGVFLAFSLAHRCREPLFSETGGGWLVSRTARCRCCNRGRLAASQNLCSSPLRPPEFNSFKLWIIYCSFCRLQIVLQLTEHEEHRCVIFFELWGYPEIGDSDYYNWNKTLLPGALQVLYSCM